MAKKTRSQQKATARTQRDEVPESCWFCDNDSHPDYKVVGTFKAFLSPRGKILGKRITGVCSRHQRGLATAVKRARYMALV